MTYYQVSYRFRIKVVFSVFQRFLLVCLPLAPPNFGSTVLGLLTGYYLFSFGIGKFSLRSNRIDYLFLQIMYFLNTEYEMALHFSIYVFLHNLKKNFIN